MPNAGDLVVACTRAMLLLIFLNFIELGTNIAVISYSFLQSYGKYSTCSGECFSLACLNLIRQSCAVLRETFVQLGKSFRGGATTPNRTTSRAFQIYIYLFAFVSHLNAL